MESRTYEAFWSYAHEDNDRQAGRVLGLANRLQDEFAVCSGDDLEFFVDRASLSWGDAWREKIDSALGEAPFFIAIVTPKYLKSPECRRELLSFVGKAKSRGCEALFLPILYVDVPGLVEDSADEVLALIARTQYVTWTALRLKASDDPAALEAVNKLALRLMDLNEEAADSVRASERRTDTEAEQSLDEIFAEIGQRQDTWFESVEFDSIAMTQWSATLKERTLRVRRLHGTSGSSGKILSVYRKLGLELAPIAEDRLEKAQSYSRLTIELDPLVKTALQLVELHPEFASLLDPLRDGVSEAMLNIETSKETTYSIPNEMAEFSNHLRDARSHIDASKSFVGEANAIVIEWRDKLNALDRELSGR